MCMMLYIGSDQPLPLLPWDEESRAFHVQDLVPHEAVVRRQFDVPHVYYAGAHEGCGCGFQLGRFPEMNEDEAPAMRENLRRLADYVEAQIGLGKTLRLFACWAGDEAAAPEHRRVVRVPDLRSEFFHFWEKEASVFALG